MARTAFRCAAFALGFAIRASLFGEGGGRQRDGSARSDGRAKVNTSRSHASGMQARASCSADAEGLAQKMGLKFFRVCTQENMNVDRGSWCRIDIGIYAHTRCVRCLENKNHSAEWRRACLAAVTAVIDART